MTELDIDLAEQREGNRQALEGLQEIDGATAQIRDGSAEMNSSADIILKEITRLGSISRQVDDRSRSIAKAAEEINSAVEKIVASSESNKDTIDVLANITSKFRL